VSTEAAKRSRDADRFEGDRRVIPFIDLETQRQRIDADVRRRLDAVLAHGRYVMGPEVDELERVLAERAGVASVVSCASGTDALLMVLMAMGVGPGDAVIVPAFTFPATPEVVVLTGATPVFCDVRADTFNIDPDEVSAALAAAEAAGLRPVGVVAVDLFGQPAEYERLRTAAESAGLWILADAAQSMGGAIGERPVGALGDVAATSFFPAKPLGAYGDGGAIFVHDDDLAGELRSIREHGQGVDKYDIRRIGINGRLDTMQAAVLLAKLEVFNDEVSARQDIAARYGEGLEGVAHVPTVLPGYRSAWAQYTVQVAERDRVAKHLAQADIPSAVYYPRPLHEQPPYRDHPRTADRLPVAEEVCGRVLSLPMHPYLDEAVQSRIVGALRAAVEETS
jgi:dTDP-4-amino-4,6-dideoxygalactose transaminase